MELYKLILYDVSIVWLVGTWL